MLPRLQPRRFDDLIVAISLIRPGPIQGNMVHPYLRRRGGEEPVSYAHPCLEPALEETLGVILFQEQVLKVARDLAGFTPGQGELLRRALGAKRADETIAALRDAFLAGRSARRACRRTSPRRCFDQLQAFGGYSFPKSHAAAFAVLVYQSRLAEALPPRCLFTRRCSTTSRWASGPRRCWSTTPSGRAWLCTAWMSTAATGVVRVEADGIRLGFNYVKGVGETGR